jgi:hypothetical protein
MGGLDGHPTFPGWTKKSLSGIGRENMSQVFKGKTVISRVWKSGKDFKALGSLRKLQSDHGLVLIRSRVGIQCINLVGIQGWRM